MFCRTWKRSYIVLAYKLNSRKKTSCCISKRYKCFPLKEIQFSFVLGSLVFVRINFPTNTTVYWLADINGSIISSNPFHIKNNISKLDQIFQVSLGKFIVIPRLLLKAAIYLKDFDNLYQRARESTNYTKIIKKSRKGGT